VASLERLSRVFRILLWDLATESGLSPIQIQFLLYLKEQPRAHCRVSVLAREFGLTRATVSDAVSTLARKGLVRKEASATDKRVAHLLLTDEGRKAARKFGNWQERMVAKVHGFDERTLETVFLFLQETIIGLQRDGTVARAHMCLGCEHFRPGASGDPARPHLCALTHTPLGIPDLKVDCPVHKPRKGPAHKITP
jgi:DNA-binding MarR family transcriptional regulator